MSTLETSGTSVGWFSLDKIKFTYGTGMQRQWVEIKNKCMAYVGALFGPSTVSSIESENWW